MTNGRGKKNPDPEDLLWLLADRRNAGEEPSPESPAPSPYEEAPKEAPEEVPAEALATYRAGTLSEEEARQLESRIAASPKSRQRLAALGGVRLDEPPAEIRRRVLAAAPGSGTGRVSAPGRSWRWPAAAAAVLLAALALPFLLEEPGGSPLPPGLSFDVTVSGQPPTRSSTDSAPASGEAVPARPDTRVSFVAEPRGQAVDGLDFGLYGQRGETLQRLDGRPPVERRLGRGTAAFTAPAAALVGSEPGLYTVFLVVGREGDLPAELPAVGLEEDGRRQVYPHRIQLLPASS